MYRYPEWTPPEKASIADAWDVAEAWELYRAAFGYLRTFEAIKREWERLHKKMYYWPREECRRFARMLDELEAMI